MSNENQKQSRSPSHIAYHVREGEDQKSYFNRIGSVWPHRDGEGFNIQLDSVPVDGRITIRTVQDRIQEAKESSKESSQGERRESVREGSNRSSSRDDRSQRDGGPRYER